MSSTESRTDPHTSDTTDDRAGAQTVPTPGRPVVLVPTPAGFWKVVGGIAVGMLAPLFGILIGSTLGSAEAANRMDGLYWGFFIGCVVGGLGLHAGGDLFGEQFDQQVGHQLCSR